MGFMDNLFSTMAEMDPNDIAKGGIIGAAMMAKARQKVNEREQRSKPGVFCNKVCVVNDERCTPCLALQQEYGNLISEIAKLEEMADLTSEQVQQLTQSKKITNCSLCGAPFEKGNKECPYCSTPYPEDGIDFDIPLSKPERRAMISEKAEEAWNSYMKLLALVNQYFKDTAGNDLFGKFQKFAGGLGSTFQSTMKHSVTELQQGADYYGVSMSQYLYCVGTGEMKAYKVLKAEEDNKRRIEEKQRRNAEFQRRLDQLQANRSKPHTAMDVQQWRAENGMMGTARYMPGDHCRDCMHWVSGSEICTLTKRRAQSWEVCRDFDKL
ncbi:MAG: hypothetical protein J1E64_08375 [Acetatifactor sp.]|nr:hypothetical protein [Acetatifactor sp.]